MIKRLLIANRGEIAIRVARTAAALGVETVGVYTADDATSLHVKHADRVRALPQAGVAGYLDIDALIAIATDTGCDAVHPGYGLLSERADFADACAAAGLVFVGPDGATLRRQGTRCRPVRWPKRRACRCCAVRTCWRRRRTCMRSLTPRAARR